MRIQAAPSAWQQLQKMMRLCPRGNLLVFALRASPATHACTHTHTHTHTVTVTCIKAHTVALLTPHLLALWGGGKVEAEYTRKQFVRSWRCHIIARLLLVFQAALAIKEWKRRGGEVQRGREDCKRYHRRGGGADLEGRQTNSVSCSSWTKWLFVWHLGWKRSSGRHVRHWLTNGVSCLCRHTSRSSSQRWGWRTNERVGKIEWQGAREWQSQKGRERTIEEGLYQVYPGLPRDLKEACIIGIFHLQIFCLTRPANRLPDPCLAISSFT